MTWLSFSNHPVQRALSRGHYLSALAALPERDTQLSHNFRLWALNSVDPWSSAWRVASPGEPAPATNAVRDPVPVIVESMRTHRAIVLMEAHGAPETRRWGARLLPALAAAGATHLAYEAPLQGPLDRFVESGLLRPDTEPYAYDPSRAELLRVARQLGLRLLAFDFASESVLRLALRQLRPGGYRELNRRREEYMAENLVRLIWKREPEVRAVIWTGEQHAWRRAPAGSLWNHPFMAAHLGRLLGEQPFCVGQRTVDEPQLAALPGLLSADDAWTADRGLDAVVLHHRGTSPRRPRWLTTRGATELAVDAGGAALVQALPAAEGPTAVPMDQSLVHDGGVELVLPPGRYLVRGLKDADVETWQRHVEVASGAG